MEYEYYNRYIKYKTKYNKLKKMMGGTILSRNYYLHVRFNKDIEDRINTLIDFLYNNVPIVYHLNKDMMPAHITLSYGPLVRYDDTHSPSEYEIKDALEFSNIYPGFLEIFKDIIPDIEYIGVTPFLHRDKIVIKIEVESTVLLEMVKYCRSTILSYNTTVKEWKQEYDTIKEELSIKFPHIFKEETSYDENPIGTLHITLINLKYDTPEAIVIDIIKLAEHELLKIGIKKGIILIPDRIDLKTPITKKFIDVFKYNE